jgi:leucyl aminopeptidase (aminopeptidase T)
LDTRCSTCLIVKGLPALIAPDAYSGAHRLLRICGNAQPQENVAIVSDANKAELAGLIAGQAVVCGAQPTLLLMSPREFDGQEPTPMIAQAMLGADLVIMATTSSLAHSEAARQALKSGARVISIPNINAELLSRGGLFADFHQVRPICRAVADCFTAADTVRIQTPAGTEITVPIEGRPGNSHDCIVDAPGMFTAVPNIEANVSPIEGRAFGRIVFDGSIPNFGIGVLHQPVVLEVAEGMVQSVSGGSQARQLERIWAKTGNSEVYNLAQVAIGLNPECRYVTGQLTNDHGVAQTMHFGIGTSKNLGGHTHASLHMDGICWYPTIWVDETMIMDAGELIVSALTAA